MVSRKLISFLILWSEGKIKRIGSLPSDIDFKAAAAIAGAVF